MAEAPVDVAEATGVGGARCSRGCCDSQAEHYRSVNLAPSATPSRKGGLRAKQIEATENRWSVDGDAYKRMRHQGLQPAQIDGSAELERHASTQQEIEMGKLFRKEDLPKVNEGIERAREITEAMDA